MHETKVTKIAKGRMQASIDSMGAELVRLTLDGRDYLWGGDARWWPRHAPVLFPIVGNIRDDQATSAAGPIRLGRHGLARNYEHRIVDIKPDSVSYQLESSPRTLEAFPYPFRLSMTYRIIGEATLEQRFEVENTGEVPLPFCIGGHPAFNVPCGSTAGTGPSERAGEGFSDYSLSFARRWSYTAPTIDTSTGLLDFSKRLDLLHDADTMPLTHELFDVDTLVFEDVPSSTVTLSGGSDGHGVTVDFDGFRYLGVWSAAGHAPFVAIEPWTGCATAADEDDVFEHKRGMVELAPGEIEVKTFEVTLF
jgi:galactose mutarotase-like enzyme